jgi:hypothetical protein
VRRGKETAKLVYEKRRRIGYVTMNRPETLKRIKEK